MVRATPRRPARAWRPPARLTERAWLDIERRHKIVLTGEDRAGLEAARSVFWASWSAAKAPLPSASRAGVREHLRRIGAAVDALHGALKRAGDDGANGAALPAILYETRWSDVFEFDDLADTAWAMKTIARDIAARESAMRQEAPGRPAIDWGVLVSACRGVYNKRHAGERSFNKFVRDVLPAGADASASAIAQAVKRVTGG